MLNNDFRQEYLSWLGANTESMTTASGTVRLTTPFVDSSNDCIEIYIYVDGDQLTMTDAGETLSDLELSGFKLSQKRKEILETIAAANGVALLRKSAPGNMCKGVICDESKLPYAVHDKSQRYDDADR